MYENKRSNPKILVSILGFEKCSDNSTKCQEASTTYYKTVQGVRYKQLFNTEIITETMSTISR